MSFDNTTIHYCWFGGNPLPGSARRCIESWRRHFPGWEIKEWNESNYDLNAILYTRQAASRGKWAFVSDYARFDILYREGGVYFATDVEVIAPFDDIMARGAFMGWEQSPVGVGVNSGLGIGAPAGLPLYREILDRYASMPYLGTDGHPLPGTVVRHVTDLLLGHGLRLEDTMQTVAGVTIYPHDYFNPFDDATGRLTLTDNTRSIHRYDKTWCDDYGPARIRLTRLLHRIIGTSMSLRIRKLLRL